MNKLTGKVVSTKMNKTIIVEVKRQVTHPVYRKILIRTKRYKVHNEDKKVNVGDSVRIRQVRPVSKEKHYLLVEIL
ncbi:30S ribosomal protein S17 [Candidatus Gottesmanbacteria bacterium RIFCSPHIGHO2_02_FULL_40_24]|uniref:Small ribosomal subunit protein uS17 n=2 Tax=Microgenomates group TaxID=1794810 RepID=A0A0H4T4J9_9BACT|nr:30S ribosomal protein S17 [uncultured Microgenomates bacterium Rifle_16ft_4_minimus_22956]OGG08044.1 MAG: 30S ribosomal protein S17 [Candidatus Gottesmanbacteria bacterium RIFCSPHIGHO2_01_FULL_40_15]OGG18222.1 MAG: 30S ribosomal protein S17 [Candidatus Gottesmanbacteria bacterium RIFCSPHIGHO2_02_FULL_40_24]OGG22890.1 MAG: 30S ribosomal protein S17 [Candidatus Gottesmanbacteria bacterium RIFCSPLOWO2_01_FULL_40_10]OGG23506.1 MAG: 30S ribosomal protein S17 [Candidatus Gottesmanbacteria bacteriu